MRSLPCLLLACLVVTSTLPASAQSADVARPTTTAGRSSTRRPLAGAVPQGGGSSKALLASFGTYVTQTGVGAGGADVSEIESGFNTFGFGMQAAASNRLADDFTVPTGQTWDIAVYRWISYQTGAPTTGTITGINLALWSSDPLLGGMPAHTGPPNSLLAQQWTGVYRVQSSALTNGGRAMIEVISGAAWTPVLGTGTYWLDAGATGSLASGPWGPVRVPRLASDNARQAVAGVWQPAVDGQSGLSQDVLFAVDGTASSSAVTNYCTSKPSSLPNCTPTITAVGATDCALDQGFLLLCGPVPAQRPGLFFYTTNGNNPTPINTPFGWLCVDTTPGTFFRVPLFAPGGGGPLSGGNPGICNGAYVLDFNRFFKQQVKDPNLICGKRVDLQFWYRDPPNPGTANTSDAVFFNMVAGQPPAAPTVTGVTPTQGGAGTVLTITGSGFGSAPGDLKVLLADGIGFADVTSASGTSLTATIFPVGNTGSGAVTVVLGNGASLPNQTVGALAILSNSSQVRVLLQGAGTNFSTVPPFSLAPGSPNTISEAIGTPLSGTITPDLSTLTGTTMRYRLAFKVSSRFYEFEGRIDFSTAPDANQRAEHFAQHINRSFGPEGVSAGASGGSVRVSMAGATYGSVVVTGL